MVKWITFCCLFLVYQFNQVFSDNGTVDVYAMEGEIIILQCENDAIDHWENVDNGSFVVYCNEFKSHLTERCNLQIRVTADDFNTTYRCIIGGHTPRVKDFKICMPTPPTSMHVAEAESGKHVVGIEDQQMTLTCNVNSGKPKETMFWIKNGKVVSSGGPGRLLYTFIPKREDNFQKYSCTANNTLNSIALRQNIQLRLTVRLSLLVNITTICTVEDMTVLLNCFETSGQQVQSYHWIYNEAGLTESSNELFLTSSNKSIDGSYTCTGENEAGSDNATLVLQEDELCQTRVFQSIHFNSDGTHINVSWKRGFVFVIEYRQHNSEMWRMISYHDTKNFARQSLQISDLRPSTEYIIRLSMSGSNGYTVSKEYVMKTKGMNKKTNGTTTSYITLIVVFTAGIVIGTVFLIKQLIKNRKQPNNEEVQQQEEDMDGIAADNQMYQSMSDLLAQPGASGHNADCQSSFERSGISYTNHDVSYDFDVNITTMENKNRETDGSFNRNGNSVSNLDRKISNQLRYIDVLFDPFPNGHTFVIRGAQNRTPYAHIDFDVHADPLPSSSESTSSCSSVIINDDKSDDNEDV